jgi:hypothetical protein
MIEGAGTIAAINYAGTQALQGEADPSRGSRSDVAKGKVNPTDRSENMYEDANSQKDSSPRDAVESKGRTGGIINLRG